MQLHQVTRPRTGGPAARTAAKSVPVAPLAALQRSAGNAAVSRLVAARRSAAGPGRGPAVPVQRAEDDSPGGARSEATSFETVTLQLQVRQDHNSLGRDFVAGHFGHAWVALYTDRTPARTACTTYGFFPQKRPSAANPFETVDGAVHVNRDQPAAASTRTSVLLNRDQLAKAHQYIDAHMNAKYNLATYNCTSFARGVYKAATGRDAPGLGLPLLENPNAIQQAMRLRNRRKGMPAEGHEITDYQLTARDGDDEDDDFTAGDRPYRPEGGLVELAPLPAPGGAEPGDAERRLSIG
ncbi:hypothetical protein [Streptomyces daghestanicus]|uniref:PPPDE domain-containing protein n=1 Tax=Streptomyces daghestanicus TaxID=66885 RepID=A0ABQ3PY35_9ACTN|nr:hypothetical protein [Streptomyces daghestanicus]GGU23525.1 hypothetical protein GCM10010259_12270 [Streptomyces daghestanicus]GHI29951.1 hypothetical protein Sdagh_16810 [Streptomyces daghestanicus]